MSTKQSSEANNGHFSTDSPEDSDYVPSDRRAFHTNQGRCKAILDRIKPRYRLEIRPSSLCDGSGLFAAVDIDACREIYSTTPVLEAVDSDNHDICHYCLKDTQSGLADGNERGETKACASCKSARYCSKECQKNGWSAHHKDECKLLARAPQMSTRNLLAHRLFFKRQRGELVSDDYTLLETHFREFSNDEQRATEIFEVASAIHDATGRKTALAVVWKMVPSLRINCVRIRMANKKESVGYALDTLTATINHSCEPNAHVYFEARELRVRSLRKIAAGEEITICYIDPTLDAFARKEILNREYFFDCRCSRCKSELREQRGMVETFRQAQGEVIKLLRSAVRASRYPGIYPELDDLPTVETRLRTITSNFVPESMPWPEHTEPLPSARLSLAMLYLGQGKPVPALRNVLKGKFLSRRRDRDRHGGGGGSAPEWVNEMVDVVTVLLVAGSMPHDAAVFEDKSFPALSEIRALTYGYAYETCIEAGNAFGGDAEYTGKLRDMYAAMIKKAPGARPGSKEFREEFEKAQEKTFAWAGLEGEKGVVLS